jgi:predicted CoA-binding protein
MLVDDVAGLRRVLQGNRVIAVVGLSPSWNRPSYFAAKYMLEHGYTVIPVNPAAPEILGQKSYPDLASIPVRGGHGRRLSPAGRCAAHSP